MNQKQDFYARLRQGPTVLFLGQNYLLTDFGVNPIVEALKTKCLNLTGGTTSLIDYLGSYCGDSPNSAFAWLHRKSDDIPIEESLHTISEFPWNHVYTTAIDNVWSRAFKKGWRSVSGIFDERYWPQDIRERHHLCGTFLFGCIDKEDKDARPPINEFSLDERHQIALGLLRRLPDILTPRGTLIIEGWDYETDWLSSKDFYPVINSLHPGQTYLINAQRKEIRDNRLLKLIETERLIILNDSLSTLIREGHNANSITLGDPGLRLPGRQITIDSHPCTIPKDLRLGVERYGAVLDDNLTLPPRKLDPAQEYFAFLRFLESPIKSNQWDSFSRHFGFERDYYRLLLADVVSALHKHQIPKAPFILHGETGTGKTVALGMIAYEVAVRQIYPVVYIERTIHNIDWPAIDRLLKWLEDSGASCSLIVWDGMRGEDEYAYALSKLADRARKVVLVGSSYLIDSTTTKSRLVIADRDLNEHEQDRFSKYLDRFDSELSLAISEKRIHLDEGFLVALYRLLPSTRPSLRAGVVAEVGHAQDEILERLKQLPNDSGGLNTLSAALELAGFKFEAANDWTAKAQLAGEQMSDIQKLFALVLVPGRYGCSVPVELLLSSLDKSISDSLLAALKTNVLVWTENKSGELFVSPRHSLEAQLYVDRVFGGQIESEVEFIKMLILGIRRPGSAVGTDVAIDFLVDLLRLIGPNTSAQAYKGRFRRFILQFAETLAILRKQKSILSPRLILQEASFVREGVSDPLCDTPANAQIILLQESIDALIEVRDRPDFSNRLLSNINEELAACYGALIFLRTKDGVLSSVEVNGLFEGALDALNRAWAIDPTNVHSTVTLGWISRRLLTAGTLRAPERAEISANLMARFDEAEIEGMDYKQQEYFIAERIRVMEAVGNIELADESFAALQNIGSKAGYFLRARQMIGMWPDSPLTAGDRQPLVKAFEYLASNMNLLEDDVRCLGLYFRIWWLLKVHQAPFSIERQVLPFNDKEWAECLQFTKALLALHGGEVRPSLKFLYALSIFHAGPPSAASEEFRSLADDMSFNLGGRRLRKMFIASKEGQPLTYDGFISQDIRQNEFGKIWIDTIRLSVNITPRDFDRQTLSKGETLSDFHLAFSYTGPVAQPPHLLRITPAIVG